MAPGGDALVAGPWGWLIVSTSGKLRLLLESEAKRSLDAAERQWFLPRVRHADWRTLRRDFPLLWQRLHAHPGSLTSFDLEGLLAARETRALFLEDVLLLAQREGLTVRDTLLGSGRSGAIRHALIGTVARQGGTVAARAVMQATRAWRWQRYREQFPDAWDAAGSGHDAPADDVAMQELVTGSPGFEQFAGGRLAELVANDGEALTGQVTGIDEGLPQAVESLSDASREVVADLGQVATDLSEVAEDAADLVVETLRFVGRWTVRGALALLGVGGTV